MAVATSSSVALGGAFGPLAGGIARLTSTSAVAGIKSVPGRVYTTIASNKNTSMVFVQLYNAQSSDVTIGTTVPLVTIPVGTSGVQVWSLAGGMEFGTAISGFISLETSGGTGATSGTTYATVYYG